MRAHADAPRDSQIAGRHGPLPALRLTGGFHQVPGDLLPHELVVGLVLLKSVDHVVAVLVCLGHGKVARVSGGVRVAHNVQPVPSPALAIPRGRQQALDKVRVGAGRVIGDELVDRPRCRGHAGEVVGQPADQGPLGGGPGRVQALPPQPRQHETVNRVAVLRGTGNLSDVTLRERPEGPVLPMLRRDLEWSRARWGLLPKCPVGDPSDDVVGLVRGQRTGGRHLQCVLVGQSLHQQAAGGVARYDGRPGLAALEEGLPRVHSQPALRLGDVAAKTLCVKQRLHPGAKVLTRGHGPWRAHRDPTL